MKSLVRDYRIFMGRTGIITHAALIGVIDGIILAVALTRLLAPLPQHIAEFIDGFMGSVAFAVPAGCIGANFGIINCNSPMTPGYKLFHFLPDCGRRFRNALLFTNIMSVVFMLAAVGIVCAYFALIDSLMSGFRILVLLSFGFAALGITNFFGFVRSVMARLVTMMAVGGMVGFMFGFMEDVEVGAEIPAVMWIIAAAAAAVWAASIVYVALSAQKWWCKEN